MDKEWTVVTPEQVQLHFQTAGLGSRTIAQLLDFIVLLVINTLLILAIGGGTALFEGNIPKSIGEYASAFFIILMILLNVGYFICTEYYMGGQTLGKRMIGLRVIQDNGQSATLLSIIIRNLFRLLDFLPMFYFLGGIAMFFNARDKRIGDMVAGTLVIVEQRKEGITRRYKIDKAIAAWPYPLPSVQWEDSHQQAFSAEDWLLLNTWMGSILTMDRARLEELSIPIAQYLSGKLTHPSIVPHDSSAYLIALYRLLREDWDI